MNQDQMKEKIEQVLRHTVKQIVSKKSEPLERKAIYYINTESLYQLFKREWEEMADEFSQKLNQYEMSIGPIDFLKKITN